VCVQKEKRETEINCHFLIPCEQVRQVETFYSQRKTECAFNANRFGVDIMELCIKEN
jgi:hypothetical protein